MPRKIEQLPEIAADGGGGSGCRYQRAPSGDTLRVPISPAAQAVEAGVSQAEWRVLVATANGLDEGVIARTLGIKLGTVKTQSRMARQKASRITGVDFEGGSASKRLVLVLVGFLPAPRVPGAPKFPRGSKGG